MRSTVLTGLLTGLGVHLLIAGVVAAPYHDRIDQAAAEIEDQVIAWRRDIHQNPELGNREFRTAALVAAHLRSLGFDEVRTEVAHTGVVGVLKGARPGKVVALRADMDALPVTEDTGLPFASTVRATYKGQDVGVAHACGHDAHVAILMGVAEMLAGMRDEIPGTVKFIFQPAEEGLPPGEEGGARLMIAEGALDNPAPDAIFALHVSPGDLNKLLYTERTLLASMDRFTIAVHGRQTHGAFPERGVDPIVVAAQVIIGLQTITSRQIGSHNRAVISVGQIEGGERFNIIPDDVVLVGTVRTLDETVRADIKERMIRTAESIAASAGATAEVTFDIPYAVTNNDPALVGRMLPSLRRVAGSDGVIEFRPVMGAEDFSFFAQRVPGFYFLLGARPPEIPFEKAAWNHSPKFVIDEQALRTGVRALAGLALDYLHQD
jgi:amidohydrolase